MAMLGVPMEVRLSQLEAAIAEIRQVNTDAPWTELAGTALYKNSQGSSTQHRDAEVVQRIDKLELDARAKNSQVSLHPGLRSLRFLMKDVWSCWPQEVPMGM